MGGRKSSDWAVLDPGARPEGCLRGKEKEGFTAKRRGNKNRVFPTNQRINQPETKMFGPAGIRLRYVTEPTVGMGMGCLVWVCGLTLAVTWGLGPGR